MLMAVSTKNKPEVLPSDCWNPYISFLTVKPGQTSVAITPSSTMFSPKPHGLFVLAALLAANIVNALWPLSRSISTGSTALLLSPTFVVLPRTELNRSEPRLNMSWLTDRCQNPALTPRGKNNLLEKFNLMGNYLTLWQSPQFGMPVATAFAGMLTNTNEWPIPPPRYVLAHPLITWALFSTICTL